MTAATVNWRDRRHWNGGKTQQCVTCYRKTHLLNDEMQPQHKVCAEKEAEAATGAAVSRYSNPATER